MFRVTYFGTMSGDKFTEDFNTREEADAYAYRIRLDLGTAFYTVPTVEEIEVVQVGPNAFLNIIKGQV